MSGILILGAGLVCQPIVTYLAGTKKYTVVVASRTVSKAEKLVEGLDSGRAVALDIEAADGPQNLQDLVDSMMKNDNLKVMISLLPWTQHLKAAVVALDKGIHFCTTSYISDDLEKLRGDFEAKGLVSINECGVDPGMDHMSAMQIMDKVKSAGGKVVEFHSFCGGLPAPEDNDNPFGYKLSWSPKGVLLATGKRDAKFVKDGKETEIAGAEVFHNYEVETVDGIQYEKYPNGDSTKYIDIYGIQGCKFCIRGTYRNTTWCDTFQRMLDLGFLNVDDNKDKINDSVSYLAMSAHVLGTDASAEACLSAMASKLNVDAADLSDLQSKMQWLGLYDDKNLPSGMHNPLDVIGYLMDEKMQYAAGEKDMLLMKHDILCENKDGGKEHYVCVLKDFGIPNGDSSMSRTVSLPLAIAVEMVVEGEFTKPGIHRPTMPELYEPILKRMEENGVKFEHSTK